MLWSLIRFEWRYYVRQPSFVVTMLLFFLMPFLATVSSQFRIGSGDILKNGTFTIAQMMLILSLFAIFLVVNFVGTTATRNLQTQMEELLYCKPLISWQYQLGRFVGVTLVVLVVFACVPLGIWFGSLMPWVDPEKLGPNQLMHYLKLYLLFPAPTLLVLSALIFALGQKLRSMMAIYLVALALLICYQLALQFSDEQEYRFIASLLDPFALATFADISRYWTISEKNTLLPAFEGVLLYNRLLWLVVAGGLLAAFGGLFSPLQPSPKRSAKAGKVQQPPQVSVSALQVKAAGSSCWQQFVLRTGFEVRQVVLSMPFIILGVLSVINIAVSLFDMPQVFGAPQMPLTTNMIEVINGSMSLLIIIIVVYYAAELVWRERTTGIGDIIDSLPVPNMVFWLSKLSAVLVLMLSLFTLAAVVTVLYQLVNGIEQLEIGQYLLRLLVLSVLPMMLNVILVFLFQVLSPNKYIGMFAFVLFFALLRILDAWGFEYNLYQYPSGPARPYSDMNGFGVALHAYSWYVLYWGALALVFFILGYALYQRGPAQPLKIRFSQLSYQLGTQGKFVLVLALLLFAGSGSYIGYNTRVLNDFVTSKQQMDSRAAYEKEFKQYQDWPILVATDVKATLDLYPAERKLVVDLQLTLRNKQQDSIRKMLVQIPQYSEDFQLEVAGATLGQVDPRFQTAWLEFAEPVAAGQQVQARVRLTRQQLGFADDNQDVQVVENGTFINNATFTPRFGYQKGVELTDRHERRKRELPPPQRANKLEDSRFYQQNFFGPESDFIQFEAVVSTDPDQTALTPGYLQREWQQDGRRYFHYKMDQPMVNFYALVSGRYQVEKQTHQGVALEVYYHPAHHWNVARMFDSMRDSLDLFQQAFGPYQHKQMRVLEFPGYRTFAQSFANTVPYSEKIGFTSDLRDPEDIDIVYYVTAHEMAHQWWGHQVGAADVQGSQVISESLSQYAALRVLEQKYGEARLRKFLKRELDSYLRGRSAEQLEEVPFMRAENQQYIHYNKGSVVMMALKDAIGAPLLDENLRHFLQEFRFRQNPYPTTLDLVRHLKRGLTPEQQALVDELFGTIRLYDLRLLDVAKKSLPDNQLELTLQIEARKLEADGKGVETELALDEALEIGAFDADPENLSKNAKVLYLQKHPLKSGKNTVVLQVPANAAYVGVDPLVKKIDRDSGDNMRKL